MTSDLAQIREAFPALERTIGGQPVGYFDGPGGTQVPRAVSQAMVDYLHHHNANTHWNYPSSVETDRMLDEARDAFSQFLRCRPEEVSFGANMTSLTLHLSRAIGRNLDPGDEIVVTELDHHANIDPWRAVAADVGAVVRQVRMNPEEGTIDWPDLERTIGPATKVLAIGAASNALGTITDVAQAAGLAHRFGAVVFVDGVHYAPHSLPDVSSLGADLFACSAYKFYGPHVGVIYCRRDLQESLDVPRLVPAGQRAPERLESGTLNHEGIAGASAAVEWLASLTSGGDLRSRLTAAYQAIHARGVSQLSLMWQGLRSIAGVTTYGPPPGAPRTPTVAFTVNGVGSGEVARLLSEAGLFVSHGDFYATTAVERLAAGTSGLVRAGCACYTTDREVERLIDGVAGIAGSAA